MAILLAILNFSKRHAQSIIVVLLGVIATASIAGGLWIRDLQERISNLEKQAEASKRLYEQRLEIEQQRSATAGAVAEAHSTKLQTRLAEAMRANQRLKEYVDRVDTVISRHLDDDRSFVIQLAGDGEGKRRAFDAAHLATVMTTSIDETRAQVSVAKDWLTWLSEKTSDDVNYESHPTMNIVPTAEHHSQGGWILFYCVAAIGGLALLWLLARLFKWSWRRVISHEEADAELTNEV